VAGPVLLPDRAKSCKSLDAWLEAYGILNVKRHDALADALATAQLLQVLKHHGDAQGPAQCRRADRGGTLQEWLVKTRR